MDVVGPGRQVPAPAAAGPAAQAISELVRLRAAKDAIPCLGLHTVLWGSSLMLGGEVCKPRPQIAQLRDAQPDSPATGSAAAGSALQAAAGEMPVRLQVRALQLMHTAYSRVGLCCCALCSSPALQECTVQI